MSSQKIQELLAANPYWLAPMAGVTDPPFRAICRRMGAGLSYTEMVSAKGLDEAQKQRDRSSQPQGHHVNNTERLLMLHPGERPTAVQLFGSDPEILGRQTRRVAEMLGQGVALIDLNAGCPVPKVFNRAEGCGLMADPATAAAAVRAMVSAVADLGVPVTVKFRRGISAETENAVEFGLAVQEAGAAAVTVHGRYRSQYYQGQSNRQTIAQVKDALDIPVIASGDIMSAADALDIRRETGADGAMVARGAMGNPWVFAQIREAVSAREAGRPVPEFPPVPAAERLVVIREHAEGIVEFFGPKSLVRMRRHVNWYCSGLPGAAHFRRRVNGIITLDDLNALISEYEAYLTEACGLSSQGHPAW